MSVPDAFGLSGRVAVVTGGRRRRTTHAGRLGALIDALMDVS